MAASVLSRRSPIRTRIARIERLGIIRFPKLVHGPFKNAVL